MIKRFPSRGQRSKGIKVKHVLQIILLLGVCFWLIYQVKHNHDKKKEFDENDAKLSVRTQTDQIPKLGRKDLHQGKDEVNHKDKREEEEDENVAEDEENKHEHDEQEEEGNKHETEESEDNKQEVREQGEENKHGTEEQEEDENKSEEIEDEGRGGGDDEIDENEQEKLEIDADHDEEFMGEEKEEGDEKENENSEDEEKGGLVENHNTHEAREEHYKGDDASSAVAHDTRTTSTETETFSSENSDVDLEMNITKPENKTTYSDESDRNQNDSDLKYTDGKLADKTSSNATAEETGNNSLSNPVNSIYLNETVATHSDSHLEATNNLTPRTTDASNNLTGASADTSNSSSSEQNKTVKLSESDPAQNTTVNPIVTGELKNIPTEGVEQSGNRVSEEHLPDTISTASAKTEHGDAGAGESSNLGATEVEKTTRILASNGTENNSRNSDRNENSDTSESDKSKGDNKAIERNEAQNIDATEDEMFKGDTQTDETSDSSSVNGTADSIEHDPIDSSDSHIHEDVTEVGTDLGTLPDIRNEGDNDDETAAE